MEKHSKIAILGASGLIGSYFASYLANLSKKEGLSLILYLCSVDKNGLIELQKSIGEDCETHICVFDVAKEMGIPDGVNFILEAASLANPIYYSTKPVETMNINYLGCLNALEYCRKNGTKMVYMSSGEVYGEQTQLDELGFVESQPGIVQSMRPRSCYTESKRACETLCSSYVAEYGVKALVCRSCFVYGPTYTANDSRVIFQFLRNALENENIVMKSDGSQLRSYLYVEDACKGLVILMERGVPGEAYNLSSLDPAVSIADLARTIAEVAKELFKSKIKVIVKNADAIEKKGFSTFQNAVQNPAKLCALGYEPTVSLKEGIERTLLSKKSGS